MKNKNKLFFTLFLISFSLANLIFALKIGLEIKSQPKATPPSNIPSLNIEKLNNSITFLETKVSLDQKENFDYSQIIFGNQEPFNR